jgi:hypothetical protein
MREYGRHVQQMVGHILSIEDKERRLRNAQAVIELMGFINPQLKNIQAQALGPSFFDFRFQTGSGKPLSDSYKGVADGKAQAIALP